MSTRRYYKQDGELLLLDGGAGSGAAASEIRSGTVPLNLVVDAIIAQEIEFDVPFLDDNYDIVFSVQPNMASFSDRLTWLYHWSWTIHIGLGSVLDPKRADRFFILVATHLPTDPDNGGAPTAGTQTGLFTLTYIAVEKLPDSISGSSGSGSDSGSGSGSGVETFHILTEDGDTLATEDGNQLTLE